MYPIVYYNIEKTETVRVNIYYIPGAWILSDAVRNPRRDPIIMLVHRRARRAQDFWTRTRFIEYFRTRDPDPEPGPGPG